MNDQDREIQRRLRVLRHAEETGNVRQTCRYFGLARPSFYRWKVAYYQNGEAGLNKKLTIAKSHPRTIPLEIVKKAVYLRRTYYLGSVRIMWYLERYHEIKMSDISVYRIPRRHGLNRLPRNSGRKEGSH